MGVFLNHIVGYGLVGLGVRLWQLGLLNRPLGTKLWVHGSYMVVFGYLGYQSVHYEAWLAKELRELKEIREKNRANAAAREAEKLQKLVQQMQTEA